MEPVQHAVCSVAESVKKDASWLKQHERIVICALVLMVAMFLGNKYLDSSAASAQSRAAVAAQQAADAKLSAQQATAQAQQEAAVYQETVREQQAQINALLGAIAQRDSNLSAQQREIKTAPLTQVAQQWQTAIGGSGDIIMGTAGLNISDDGSRRTLSQLLELPVVKADLSDETKIAQSTQKELDSANQSISALNGNVSALNIQIKADDRACKEQLDAQKKEARKSKRNWFIGGTVFGTVLRTVIKAYVGI